MRIAAQITLACMVGLAAAPPMAPAWAADSLVVAVPAAPGSPLDTVARAFADAAERSGIARSSEVVDIPGDRGRAALARFIHPTRAAHSDLLLVGPSLIVTGAGSRPPLLLTGAVPIARLTRDPLAVVVREQSELRDARDLVEAVRREPGAVALAGGPAGRMAHIAAGLLAEAAGIDPARVNYVPFLSSTEALGALLDGDVIAAIGSLGEYEGQIARGRLRLIGLTGESPSADPERRTFVQQGVDLVAMEWRGLLAPVGLGRAEQQRLSAFVRDLVSTEAWRATAEAARWTQAYQDGEAFASFLVAEELRIRRVAEKLGLAQPVTRPGATIGR